MNAPIERSNRTVSESFVDDHHDRLVADLSLFSRKLADGPVFYHTGVLPHHLSQKPP